MLVSLDLFNGMENNPMTQYQPYGHPHPGLTPRPPEPRNGMGVASLVLGIVGIALAWVPIVGFLGFITGIIGTIFGPVGISRANKGLATNKGVAIAGLIVSIGAVLTSTLVFFSFAAYVANEGATSSGTRSSSSSSLQVPTYSPPLAPAEPIEAEAPSQLQVGQTANIDGFEITAGELTQGRSTIGGDAQVCSMISIVNNSGVEEDFNFLEWKIQDPEGVQHSPSVFSAKNLTSGDLAPGGKVSGNICAEIPFSRGSYLVIYGPMWGDQVTWAASR